MSVTLKVVGEYLTFDEVLAHLHRLRKGETLELDQCIIDRWEGVRIADAAAEVYFHDGDVTGPVSGITVIG